MQRLIVVLGLLAAPLSSAAAQEGLATWTLTEDLRIGAVDGPAAFNAVGPVVATPGSERVFVSDASDRIVVFDAQGNRVDTIGRRGRGPGEFDTILRLQWVDGAVVVSDPLRGTLTRFSEEGAVLDVPVSQSTQFSAGFRSGRAIAALSSGYFLGSSARYVPGVPLLRSENVLFRMDGTGRDTLLDQYASSERLIYDGKWLAIPMAPVWRYAVHPYGESIVTVHQSTPSEDGTGQFRVRKLDGAGRLAFSRAYNYPPRPLPRDYLDVVLSGIQAGLTEMGISLRDVKQHLLAHMPEYELPVSEVHVATGGSIWLRREDRERSQVWWLVLDQRGDPVGQLQLPAHLRVRHIGEEAVWAVDTDEWGVNYLVKYALLRG